MTMNNPEKCIQCEEFSKDLIHLISNCLGESTNEDQEKRTTFGIATIGLTFKCSSCGWKFEIKNKKNHVKI